MGKMFLIAIDAHSKWIEAHSMTSITSAATMEKLRSMFAEHGIPAVLVSDNGPSLVSTEFKLFLKKKGIKHITSAPYHPASNGLAERAVRVFKEGMSGNKSVTIPPEIQDHPSDHDRRDASRAPHEQAAENPPGPGAPIAC